MHQSRNLLVLSAAALLAVGLTGCHSGTEGTAQHTDSNSKAVPGWTEVKSSGVAISLPSELPVLDLSSGDVAEIQKKASGLFANSPDAQQAASKAMSNGNLKLMAMEKTQSTPGFRNNFNLLVIATPSSLTEDQLLAAGKDAMEKISVPNSVTGEVMSLPAGKCVHLESTIKAQALTYGVASYTFIHDSKQFVFSFSRGLGSDSKWSDIAKKAVQTVRFTN